MTVRDLVWPAARAETSYTIRMGRLAHWAGLAVAGAMVATLALHLLIWRPGPVQVDANFIRIPQHQHWEGDDIALVLFALVILGAGRGLRYILADE
jgi:hypothetical protein